MRYNKLIKVIFVTFMMLFLSLQASGASALNIKDGQAIQNSKAFNISNLIILPKENYNIDEVNKMIGRIEKIPSLILKELYKKNVNIILTNTNITEVKEYEYLKGVTPRGWEETGKTWDDVPGAGGKPVVARIGYSDPGEAHGSVNLELHETAHAIDAYVFNNISSSEEYKAIWRKEVVNLFGNEAYFVNYSEEYFAETFAMYYLNEAENSKLKEKAPLTYEFIKNLEMRLSEVTSNLTSYSFFIKNYYNLKFT
ncbi:hypothetical protein CLHOM_17820 [Clostridium homopropionicum DSM 5847]|uniref:ATLF-like domain-containing protein n=1 Tax=Clostridium homopropionicum DSM 5847 TaxID=1121318 RepID=A0A0L6ZAA4_9CLOT|nr:hypothetical protein [Clostridium homopropionicum]KOA19693.1 hypothetical protein CLHOM_17820 [Clostridium homopropionicum DSM 5847]SFF79871.1 hypothetical protein SAMN04488501_102212 [Clostridium homopropionicum]